MKLLLTTLLLTGAATAQWPVAPFIIPAGVIWAAGPLDVQPGEWVVVMGVVPVSMQTGVDQIHVTTQWISPSGVLKALPVTTWNQFFPVVPQVGSPLAVWAGGVVGAAFIAPSLPDGASIMRLNIRYAAGPIIWRARLIKVRTTGEPLRTLQESIQAAHIEFYLQAAPGFAQSYDG